MEALCLLECVFCFLSAKSTGLNDPVKRYDMMNIHANEMAESLRARQTGWHLSGKKNTSRRNCLVESRGKKSMKENDRHYTDSGKTGPLTKATTW